MSGASAYHYRLKKGAAGAPILFAFHGTGGDENQFFDFAAELIPSAAVVAPRGDVSEGGALRFFRRKAEGVYDMDDLAERRQKMATFVSEHVAAHGGGPVLGLGYSNGANILAAMMLADGRLFDGAFLMHPLIPWRPEANAGLAGRHVAVTAGRRDPICPPAMTQALADHLTAQGVLLDLTWHEGGHEIRQVEIDAAGRFVARYD